MSRVRTVSDPPWKAATGAGAGATLSASLPVFLLGAAAVQIRGDLEFGEAAFGVLVAAFFGASAVFSALAGFTAERTGGRMSMLLASGVAGLCMLSVGLLVRSWWTLLATMVLAGTAGALAQPAANLTITRIVPDGRRALALAVKQSAPPVATLIGGIALVGAVPVIGWRPIFVMAAVLVAVFAWWFSRLQDLRVPFVRSPSASGAIRPFLPLGLLALGALLGSAAANSIAAFFVQGVTSGGRSAAVAGVGLTVGSMAGIIARLALGWAADRSRRRPLPIIGLMLLLGTAGAWLLAWQGAPLFALIAATALAFGAGWGWPGLFNYAVVTAYPDAPAGATGITQTGMFGGGSVGPVLFGVIAEHGGFAAAWMSSAGALMLAGVAVIAADALLRDP